MIYILAGDPGNTGSYALLRIEACKVSLISWCSIKHEVTWKHHLYLAAVTFKPKTFVEDVHSFPGQGVASSFTFGQALGSMVTALELTGTLITYIQPKGWQRRLGLPHHSEIRNTSKRRTAHRKSQKELALKLFPELAAQIEKFKKARKMRSNENVDVYASILIGYAAALDELKIPLGKVML